MIDIISALNEELDVATSVLINGEAKSFLETEVDIPVPVDSDSGFFIPFWIYRKLMSSGDNWTDIFVLYAHYLFTATLQRTNIIRATNKYCQTGLGWSHKKIIKIKRKLKDLGLIDVINHRDEKGKIVAHYVVLKHIHFPNNDHIQRYQNDTSGNLQRSPFATGGKMGLVNSYNIKDKIYNIVDSDKPSRQENFSTSPPTDNNRKTSEVKTFELTKRSVGEGNVALNRDGVQKTECGKKSRSKKSASSSSHSDSISVDDYKKIENFYFAEIKKRTGGLVDYSYPRDRNLLKKIIKEEGSAEEVISLMRLWFEYWDDKGVTPYHGFRIPGFYNERQKLRIFRKEYRDEFDTEY